MLFVVKPWRNLRASAPCTSSTPRFSSSVHESLDNLHTAMPARSAEQPSRRARAKNHHCPEGSHRSQKSRAVHPSGPHSERGGLHRQASEVRSTPFPSESSRRPICEPHCTLHRRNSAEAPVRNPERVLQPAKIRAPRASILPSAQAAHESREKRGFTMSAPPDFGSYIQIVPHAENPVSSTSCWGNDFCTMEFESRKCHDDPGWPWGQTSNLLGLDGPEVRFLLRGGLSFAKTRAARCAQRAVPVRRLPSPQLAHPDPPCSSEPVISRFVRVGPRALAIGSGVRAAKCTAPRGGRERPCPCSSVERGPPASFKRLLSRTPLSAPLLLCPSAPLPASPPLPLACSRVHPLSNST